MPVLKKRDAGTPAATGRPSRPGRTLLDPSALAERVHRSHLHPSTELAPFVSIGWMLRWDLPARDAFVQHVLPDPCVQIIVEAGGAYVMGVVTRLFSATLTGSRCVFGLKFRPGGFHPFIRRPVAALTNRTVRLAEIFPGADEPRLQDFAAAADGRAVMAALEGLLFNAAPTRSAPLQDVQRVAERIAGDPAMLTVEHVSRVFGIGPRSLQRLFRTYVGAGPKWMIRLYRIKEAAARIEEGNVVDWADLAGQLGYADQSHFINDFRRLVGRSPGEYAVRRGKDG